MEQKFGAEMTYRGRVYNVRPLSKGTSFSIRFSSKNKNTGEYDSAFMNVYSSSDVVMQDKADYIIKGFITVDSPWVGKDGQQRPAQIKLFANYVEPMNQPMQQGMVDRTQAQMQNDEIPF